MARDQDKIRITVGDQKEAERHNRKALKKYVDGTSDVILAAMVLDNIDVLESMNKSIDWDETRDLLMARSPEARRVLSNAIGKADTSKIERLNIKDKKFERTSAEDLARIREGSKVTKQFYDDKIGSAFLSTIDRTSKALLSTAKLNIGSGIAYGLGAAADGLYTARMATQKLLNISPSKGAIIGSLMVADAFVGAAAFAATPYTVEISNAHMMSAFQQACMTNTTAAGAAFDRAFSPLADANNNESAYAAMKIAEFHGIPAQAGMETSYLESARHRDLVANNSSASGYFQFLDKTALYYLKQYGQQTLSYQLAKEAVEIGNLHPVELAQKVTLVNAIDAVANTSVGDLNQMVENKKFPDVIFNGLTLADTPIMQVELVAIDMGYKTNLKNPGLSAEEIHTETVNYYREYHFLGEGAHNALEMLQANFPATPIDAAQGALSYNMAQHMARTVSLNPGLLEKNMTADEALSSIRSNFSRFVDPVHQKFAAHYDPSKSVAETCLVDSTSGVETRTITRLEYTADVLGKGVKTASLLASALTPSFIKGDVQTTSMDVQNSNAAAVKPALSGKTPPQPHIRPAEL